MEIRITDSVGEATGFVMRLAHGILMLTPPELDLNASNEECLKILADVPTVEKPNWLGFSFFSRIVAKEIRVTKHIIPEGNKSGRREVEREIEFYWGRRMIASATVAGVQYGVRQDGSGDDQPFWAVLRLRYLDFAQESRVWVSETDDEEEAFGALGKWREINDSNFARITTILD